MKIVCTICCKDKRTDKELLPARQRYLSDRIALVNKIADTHNTPFFILSGEYGLISAEEKIPWYDHLLKDNEVDLLVPLVMDQIEKNKISQIDFYAEPRTINNWNAYYQTLEKAIKGRKTKLVIRLLETEK